MRCGHLSFQDPILKRLRKFTESPGEACINLQSSTTKLPLVQTLAQSDNTNIMPVKQESNILVDPAIISFIPITSTNTNLITSSLSVL